MSVGIGEIDVQHRKMINQINDIGEAIDDGRSKETIEEDIRLFEAYSEEHFKMEEAFMLGYYYPEYPGHKKLHEDTTAGTKKVMESFKNGKITPEEIYEEGRKLAAWFVDHMKNVDSRLAVFLRSKIR
jgi:hemerythrin-like metal-binding protein